MRSARSLALVATLAGLPVLAAFTTDGRFRLSRDLRAGERGWVSGLLDVAPEFYFAGISAGAVASSICDVFDSGVGEWWCLHPDGGTQAGSIPFTVVNGTISTSENVCSHGANCDTALMRGPLNGSTSLATLDRSTNLSTAPDGGDFTACVVSTSKPVVLAGSYGFPLNKSQDGEGQLAFAQDRAASTITETVKWSNGIREFSTTLIPGVEQLRCFTFLASTGYVDIYKDGTAWSSGGGYTSDIWLQNKYWGVGGRPQNTGIDGFATFDYHRGAFFTQRWIDAGSIASMVDALFIDADDLATDSGTALTWARNSTRACVTADTTRGSHLNVDRPCIRGSGVNVAPATTNLLLRSDSLAQVAAVTAPWVEVGTPVLTGAFTADFTGFDMLAKIEDNDGAASEGVAQSVATTAAVKYTASCWLASGTLTVARLKIVGTGDATGDTTCTITGLVAGAVRQSCSTTAAYGAPVTAVSLQVLVGTNDAATGTVSAGACQLVTGDTAGPYVRTDGTQASSVADVLSASYSFASGVASSSGVWRAPEGLGTARYLVNARKDANNGFQAFTDSTGALICRWRVGGTNYDIASTAAFTASTASSWKCSTFAGGSSACVGGACVTANDGGTITPATGSHAVYIATSNTTGNEADGILSGLCLDGLATRCQ